LAYFLLQGVHHSCIFSHTTGHHNFGVKTNPIGHCHHPGSGGLMDPGYNVLSIFPFSDKGDDLGFRKNRAQAADGGGLLCF
jgi:hypothetical protein